MEPSVFWAVLGGEDVHILSTEESRRQKSQQNRTSGDQLSAALLTQMEMFYSRCYIHLLVTDNRVRPMFAMVQLFNCQSDFYHLSVSLSIQLLSICLSSIPLSFIYPASLPSVYPSIWVLCMCLQYIYLFILHPPFFSPQHLGSFAYLYL